MAASPPGSASSRRWPQRVKPARSASRSSPPQMPPSLPRPVPSKATPRAGPGRAVLGQAGGDVGVVVLDGEPGEPARLGPAGGSIVGVQVVGDRQRRPVEQALQLADGLLEPAEGGEVVEVAQVLRDDRLAAFGQADGDLHLGADRQHGGPTHGQLDRLGRVPAAPAQRARRPRHDAHDRVVHPGVDGPIVEQEAVGQRTQPLERVGVLAGDRLLAAVAAGHHLQGRPQVGEQLLQRRGRQEEPHLGQRGRHAGGERGARPQRTEHDGADGRDEGRRRGSLHPRHLLGGGQVAGQDGERAGGAGPCAGAAAPPRRRAWHRSPARSHPRP